MQNTLSLILPTYNESENVPELLQRLDLVLKNIPKEVIVVDDNSPDKTWEVAEKLMSQYPWLRVLRRTNERGLSSAVLAGFAIAKGNYLGVMDADLQHDEKILPKLYELLMNGADIAIGSRKSKGGKIENWSLFRKMVSNIASWLSRIILGQSRVSDPMSGYFVLNRKIYENCKAIINPLGFKILLEFIVRAPQARIEECGFVFRPRSHGKSKLSQVVIFQYLKALWDLRKFVRGEKL